MKKKRVVLTVMVDVEYDETTDVVSRGLDPEWHSQMYHFSDEDEVLAYLAWYIGCRQLELSRMDGWADLGGKEISARVAEWVSDDVRDNP